jgi:hypothetical protein
MNLPIFNHTEMHWLYESDFSISDEKIETLLTLPRKTLVADLEEVLVDSIERLIYYEELLEDDQATEENFSAPLHALFLLGELKSTESMSVVFEIFQQDEDFLDLWFVDHITETLWEPVYKMCEASPKLLKDFLVLPDVETFARAPFAIALSQILVQQPQRRAEIITLLTEVVVEYSKLPSEQVDRNYISILISQLTDIRAVELLPVIKQLYNKGYVNNQKALSIHQIEQDIRKPVDAETVLEILSIDNRYRQLAV